jgi:hypothetical protein
VERADRGTIESQKTPSLEHAIKDRLSEVLVVEHGDPVVRKYSRRSFFVDSMTAITHSIIARPRQGASPALGPRLRHGCGLDGILDRAGSSNYVMARKTVTPSYPRTRSSAVIFMDAIEPDSIPELISIARARALLGDEAVELSDDDVDTIRRHVHAMAQVLIDAFLSRCRPGLRTAPEW